MFNTELKKTFLPLTWKFSPFSKNTNLLPPASMIPLFHILFTPLYHFLPLYTSLFFHFFHFHFKIFSLFCFIPLVSLHFVFILVHFVFQQDCYCRGTQSWPFSIPEAEFQSQGTLETELVCFCTQAFNMRKMIFWNI